MTFRNGYRRSRVDL